MADQPVYLSLPVTGALDTADPIGNRPLGTLVVAKDVSPRTWGPRTGSKAFTRVWEGPGTAALYDYITTQSPATDCYGAARSYEDQFRNLGTKFTLDLYFRLDDTSYASGSGAIGLYYFGAGGIGTIRVFVLGPDSGADEGKISVAITTSETLIKADVQKSLTSTNAISRGTTQAYNHHVRIVRDGGTATLYVDGVQEDENTTLIANSPINAAYGSYCDVYVGQSVGAGITFFGRIFGAVLRDGAFDSQPIEAVMPCSAWAPNVHHYILGRNFDLNGDDHYFDAGRFGVHPRIIGSDYTVTASTDDAAPAPAPVQGMTTWTTRTNRTVTTALVGGQTSSAFIT